MYFPNFLKLKICFGAHSNHSSLSSFAGDLWSYNVDTDEYVVSPNPDVCSFELDVTKHKCIILASDGLWNMVKPQEALDLIEHYVSKST